MDRESQLEKFGLVEPSAPAPTAAVVEPVSSPSPAPTPAPAPARAPWTKPAAPAPPPAKVEEKPPLLAGKYANPKELAGGIRELSKKLGKESEVFTDLKEAEDYYKNLEREFHARPPEQRETPRVEPKPQPDPTPDEDDIPDAILDPQGFKSYVRNLPVAAARMASQIIAGERATQDLINQWKKDNEDISELFPELERSVTSDPRSRAIKDPAGLSSIISDHTQRLRAIAQGFIEAGRQDALNKNGSLQGGHPQTQGERQPPPPAETPAETLDEVDSYIAEREAHATARRGYGFSRDDASRSMNSRP